MGKHKRDKSILLFAYGNISRGDDALGPLLLQQIQQRNIQAACGYPVEFLQDFQIQVEHVMDMQRCERVLLIDASQSLQQGFAFYPIKEQQETCYTTHGMSASNLLNIYRQVHHQAAPSTYMLAIQGFHFELGQALSSQAQINLQSALNFLIELLSSKNLQQWDTHLKIWSLR